MQCQDCGKEGAILLLDSWVCAEPCKNKTPIPVGNESVPDWAAGVAPYTAAQFTQKLQECCNWWLDSNALVGDVVYYYGGGKRHVAMRRQSLHPGYPSDDGSCIVLTVKDLDA